MLYIKSKKVLKLQINNFKINNVKRILFCIIFLVIYNYALGQSKTVFSFNDSIFFKNNEKNIPLFDFLYFNRDTSLTDKLYIDSLKTFLNRNKNLIIEIGCYSDYRGTDKINLQLTQIQAKNIINVLIHKGVLKSQLIALGYGEINLFYNEKYINSIDDINETENLHKLNNRIVRKILKN